MMPQMVPLHGMHRPQHCQAEDEHDQIGRPPRQPERVMKRAVHDAQPRQEEDERGDQRQRIQPLFGENQRSDKPGQRQQQFAHGIPGCGRREIAPVDLV